MHSIVRIGLHIGNVDPFWIQVREGIYDKAHQAQAELIPIDTIIDTQLTVTEEDYISLTEELIVEDLDVIITSGISKRSCYHLLERGIPIVSIAEVDIDHPRFTAVTGLYDIGYMAGEYISERIDGKGSVLVFGGVENLS